MTSPNQITACSSSNLQGVYCPEVHVYGVDPHPHYGLLPVRYFFKGRSRDRAKALATARAWIKQAKGMTPDDARVFFAANALNILT